MTNHRAPVFINEGAFGIFDHGEVPIESADWSGVLIAPMSAGVMVRTGINTGKVRVEARTGVSQEFSVNGRRKRRRWSDEESRSVPALRRRCTTPGHGALLTDLQFPAGL